MTKRFELYWLSLYGQHPHRKIAIILRRVRTDYKHSMSKKSYKPIVSFSTGGLCVGMKPRPFLTLSLCITYVAINIGISVGISYGILWAKNLDPNSGIQMLPAKSRNLLPGLLLSLVDPSRFSY